MLRMVLMYAVRYACAAGLTAARPEKCMPSHHVQTMAQPPAGRRLLQHLLLKEKDKKRQQN